MKPKNNWSFYKTRETEQEVNAFINIQIKCCKWKRKQVGLPGFLLSAEVVPQTLSSYRPNPRWKPLWRSMHPPTSFSWARANLPQLQAKNLAQSLTISSLAMTSLPSELQPMPGPEDPSLVTGNCFFKLQINDPKTQGQPLQGHLRLSTWTRTMLSE